MSTRIKLLTWLRDGLATNQRRNMMDEDILVKLLNRTQWSDNSYDVEAFVAASDEIRLLREALKPFSELFLYPDDLGDEHAEDIRSDADWNDDANDMQTEDVFVLRRDIRRARELCKKI